jgi:uncharacterized protein
MTLRSQLNCFSAVALLVFMCVARPARPESVKDIQKPTDYVTDLAHILSPDGIAKLDKLCSTMDHGSANAQVAVVTVDNLDGEDPADWANDLENKWKMGKKGSDRGVLVLLSMDHHWRIDVGYGLEGDLNDAKIGDIGRAIKPLLHSGDYSQALLQAVSAISSAITPSQSSADSGAQQNTQPTPQQLADQHNAVIAESVLGGLFVLVFVVVLIRGFRKDATDAARHVSDQENDLADYGRTGHLSEDLRPHVYDSPSSISGAVVGAILSSDERSESKSKNDDDEGIGSVIGGGDSDEDNDSFGGFDGGDFGGGGAGGDWS